MNNQPIGVLDSGVGGLTVLKEIHKELPQESTIYIGDSKNAPYGERSPENIKELSVKLIQSLLKKNVKLIVVACNTITVNAIEELRAAFPDIPIIGTVPVIKKAAALTKNKKIGLLVTEATEKSTYNQKLIDEFASGCEVFTVGTNALVPLIETEQEKLLPEAVAKALAPFKKANVDTVVLGSTHFPILRNQIAREMGSEVTILDSGGAITRQVRRILTSNAILASSHPTHYFYTTGEIKPFTTIVKRTLGESTPQVEQVVVQ